MEYLTSSETDYSIEQSEFSRVCQRVDEAIRRGMDASDLTDVDITVIYVPILMNDTNRRGNPARSRVKKAQRTVECAPQLDNARYLAGDEGQKALIYLNGLREVEHLLGKLGVSDEQAQLFNGVLDDVEAELRQGR